jgi:hypothetical protein
LAASSTGTRAAFQAPVLCRRIARADDDPPCPVVLVARDAAFGIRREDLAAILVVDELGELITRAAQRRHRRANLRVGEHRRAQHDIGQCPLRSRAVDVPVATGRVGFEAVLDDDAAQGAGHLQGVEEHAVADLRVRPVAIAVEVDPHDVCVRHHVGQGQRLPAVGRAGAVRQGVLLVVVGIGAAGIAEEHGPGDRNIGLDAHGCGHRVAGGEAAERAIHRAVAAGPVPHPDRVVLAEPLGIGLRADETVLGVVQPLDDATGGVDRVLQAADVVVDVARAVRERIALEDDIAGGVVLVGGGQLEAGRIDDLLGASAQHVVEVLGGPRRRGSRRLDEREHAALSIVRAARLELEPAGDIVDDGVLELALGVEGVAGDGTGGIGDADGAALAVVAVARAQVQAGGVRPCG